MPSLRPRRLSRLRARSLVVAAAACCAPVACNAVFGVSSGELAESASSSGQGGAASSTSASGGGPASTGSVGGSITTGGGGGAGPVCSGLGGVDASAFVRAKRAGGSYEERGTAVAFNDAGGVVVAGTFSDPETIFGASPLPYPESPPEGPDEADDLFLAQYKPNGSYDWAVAFNAPGAQWFSGMARDAATGDLLLAGSFTEGAAFGETLLTADKSRYPDALDAFVARVGPTGAPQWAKRLGGQDNEAAMAIAVDSHGAVVVAGETFSGYGDEGADVDFGCGTQHIDAQLSAVFLTKLGADGSCVWSHVFPIDTGFLNYWNPGWPLSLAIDRDDDILLAGGAGGITNSFGEGPLDSFGDYDVFLYKCDADGNYLYATTFGDGAMQYASALAVDACGDVYLAGSFRESMTMGQLPKVAPAAGDMDPGSTQIFVARLDAAADRATAPSPVWLKGFWDDGYHEARSLRVDGASNLLLAGSLVDGPHSAGVDFGDGAHLSGPGKSSYGDYRSDLFLAKLRGDGSLRWARRQGGVETEYLESTALAEDGRIAVTGSFDEPFDFGGGVLTPANLDMFVMQLGP